MRLFAEKLKDGLLRQRERWVLWAPVALAGGSGAYFSLHAEPPPAAGPVALALFILALAPFYRNRRLLLLSAPLLLILLGFAAAQERTWRVATPMLERKTYPLLIEGRVAAVDVLPEGYRFLLDRAHYRDEKYPEKTPPQKTFPKKVRLRLKKGDTPPSPGDRVRVRAILLPISPPVLPGAYDFQRHMFYAGIGATGFALGNVEVVAAGESSAFFPALRGVIGTHIRGAMENSDAAAITTALVDGEDRNISKDMYEKIRRAGLAHLIAISGLQVTLVTGFFFFAVRALLASIPFIALRYPVKKITAFAALLGALFYMQLIGDSISAVRSVIMVCAVMGAVMLDRDPLTLRMAAFAATLLLLVQPESLFGPSFQLSFAAVTALIAFYESTKGWWSRSDQERRWPARLGLYVLGSMATTLVATCATAPIALYHFLRTPLFPGLVANLVAVPLSSFITMPAAIIGCLLIPVGLEAVPLKVAEWSALAIMRTAEVVSAWPYADYRTEAWPLPLLVVMALGGLWICLWRGRMRWFGLLPAVAAAAFIPFMPRADIIAAGDAKLFAVRDAAGVLWISSERTNKFMRAQWVEREGGRGHAFWPKENTGAAAPVACDAAACIYRRAGHTVSFIRNRDAIVEDCAAADIVIGYPFIDRRACPQPAVLLDGHVLKEGGTHALYFAKDGRVTVRSVQAARGLRPWSGGGDDEDEAE